MVMAQPHFLLFCDATATGPGAPAMTGRGHSGSWHFTLEQLDGNRRLEVADIEEAANHERLALMSVVRGLEALEQPSKVTLVTTSRYVSRGLRYGLNAWRERDYTWERFGVQMPIRNADLWQRVDGAMRFHGVTCRLIQAAASVPGRINSISANRELCSPLPATLTTEDATRLELPDGLVTKSSESGMESAPRGALHQPWQIGRLFSSIDTWWQLATHWIRWWRGRFRARPALLGT